MTEGQNKPKCGHCKGPKKDQDGAKMSQEGAKMDSIQAKIDQHEAKKRAEDLPKMWP